MFFILISINLVLYIVGGFKIYDFLGGNYKDTYLGMQGIAYLCLASIFTLFIVIFYTRKKKKSRELKQHIENEQDIGNNDTFKKEKGDKATSKHDFLFSLDCLDCAIASSDEIFDCADCVDCDTIDNLDCTDCDGDLDFIDCDGGLDCLDCVGDIDCTP